MVWTLQTFLIALYMVVSGSINTLTSKFVDRAKSRGSDGKDRNFDHPFFQTEVMFLGELLCFFAYKILYFYYTKKNYSKDQLPFYIAGNLNFNPFYFMITAMCDLIGSALMFRGLIYTDSSSYQMLRGSLVVFACLLSCAFLRTPKLYELFGVIIVTLGLVVVGVADVMQSNNNDTMSILLGDLLIVFGQIFTAIQLVLQEKFMKSFHLPVLLLVGIEGIFGFIILGLLHIPFYYIQVEKSTLPNNRLEDFIDACYQIFNSWKIFLCLLGFVISIVLFNFTGLCITHKLSATTRTVLDSLRTVIVKVVTIIIGIEYFSWIQLLGFIILIFGTLVYNNAISFVKIINRLKQLGDKEDDRVNILRESEQEQVQQESSVSSQNPSTNT